MRVKLGDIFEIGSGGTPSKSHPEYYGGNIPWVKTGDLKNEYLYEVEDFITEEGLNNSSAKMYEADTVLIAMYGATIGATSILKMNACTNQACAAFKKNEQVIPEYLYYFLRSQKEKFVKDGVGGAQPNISAGYLKKVEMELPSLDEQKVIVDILDKISDLVCKRSFELRSLDDLIKARFVELFGEPSTNPKGYPVKVLPEIAEYWNGLTYKPEDVSDEGTIVLRSSNIQNATLDFADTVRVSCKIGDKKYVQDNDILMCSRNGSARLVGKVALIKDIEEPMSFGAFMMIIRSDYYPYLMTYFQMPAFRAQITTGATTTINQITGRMLDIVKLPVPDMDVINEFADFVHQVDKSKVAVQKSLDETQQLFDSLMQQYFG